MRTLTRYLWLLWFIVPILVMPSLLFLVKKPALPQIEIIKKSKPEIERLIVIIVDSLRPSDVEKHMPNLKSFSKNHTTFSTQTCLASITLPCVRTLFEGIEAEPSTALLNFVSVTEDAPSLISTLKAHDWRIELYSNHILGLYANEADFYLNIESVGGSILEQDIELLRRVGKSLDENRTRQFLAIHVPGTDKMAHFSEVDGEKYHQHFFAVDAELKKIFQRLDFKKDLLVVLGDHGHDDEGLHTKDSLAIFGGPEQLALNTLPDLLNATDLLFPISFATGVPLPNGYEGRSFWLNHAPETLNPSQQMFQDLEKQNLQSLGIQGDTLAELLSSNRSLRLQDRLLALLNAFSTTLIFIAFLILLFITLQPQNIFFEDSFSFPYKEFIFLSILFIISIFFRIENHFSFLSIIFTLSLWVLTIGYLTKKIKYGVIIVLLLVITSVVNSYFGKEWILFFEKINKGGFGYIFLYSFIILTTYFANQLVFKKIRTPTDRVSSFFIPFLSIPIAMIALASGGFYCNSGPNFLQSFIFIGAFLLFFNIWKKMKKNEPILAFKFPLIMHGIVLLIIAGAFQQVSTENWVWQFEIIPHLDQYPLLSIAILGFSFVYLFLISNTPKRFLGIILPHLSLIILYSMFFAGLSIGSVTAALLPSLFLGAFLQFRDHHDNVPLDDTLDGILLFATLFGAAWITMGGFEIGNIDFAYFDKYFAVENFSTDLQRVGLYGILSFFKYLFPFTFPISVYFSIRKIAFRPLLYAILLMLFQLSTLVLDLLAGVASKNPLYAFTLGDLFFVWSLVLYSSIFIFYVAILKTFTPALIENKK